MQTITIETFKEKNHRELIEDNKRLTARLNLMKDDPLHESLNDWGVRAVDHVFKVHGGFNPNTYKERLHAIFKENADNQGLLRILMKTDIGFKGRSIINIVSYDEDTTAKLTGCKMKYLGKLITIRRDDCHAIRRT